MYMYIYQVGNKSHSEFTENNQFGTNSFTLPKECF